MRVARVPSPRWPGRCPVPDSWRRASPSSCVQTPVHPVETFVEAARQDVPLHHHLDLAGDGAVGGELGSQGGDDELAHAQPGGVAPGVLGAGPTEGVEGEVPRIMAPLHGDPPDEVVHLLAGDLDDPVGRLLDGEPQGDGDVRGDGVGRRGGIQSQRPTEPVDQTEHHGGVGDRRHGPAPPVTGRARDGPGAGRPDPQDTQCLVEPGDAAPAGADRGDVDHRDGQGLPLDHGFGREHHLAVDHQAHVEAGPAHVGGDDMAVAELTADHGGRRHPAHRARVQGLDRHGPGHGGRKDPAAHPHHDEEAGEPALAQAVLQPGQVGRDQRADVGVHDHGGRPLVFADARHQPAGDREVGLGEHLFGQFGQRLLVGGVGHRPQQRDGYRVDTFGRQLLQPGAGVTEAERDEDAPGPRPPARRPPGEPPGHQQRGLDPSGRLLQLVVGQPVDLVGLGDGQGRLEPGGGQQAHGGPGAGQEGVQARRGPVGQDVCPRQQLRPP